MTSPEINWLEYRKCGICMVGTGNPCVSRSGRIVDGQPDGIRTELKAPHKGRRLRTAKRMIRVPSI